MIGRFSRPARAEREAALWAIRRPNPADAPDAAFTAWLGEHPSHAELYQAFCASWNDRAVAQALKTSARATNLAPSGFQAVLMAASFVCFLLVAGLFAMGRLLPADEPSLRFETQAGHSLTTRLADGSQIQLNGDSAVWVSIGPNQREIVLERGQGFFDVRQDVNRPLIIKARGALITVIGTAFDLDLTDNDVSLSVYRGKVDFARRDDSKAHQLASAGQRITLKGDELRREKDFDPQADDWRNGWLETDDITLARLVQKLNRSRAQPIVVADAKLGDIRVAGRLHIGEPDQLLTRLANLHHFHIQQGDGKTRLTL